MSDIKERIRQIIEREELTAAAFAESIGVAQATISHILGSRNKYPSTDFILRLHQRYPDIDMNWLLTGAGSLGDGGREHYTPTATGANTNSSADLSKSSQSNVGGGVTSGNGSSDPDWPSFTPGDGYPLFSENAKFQPTVQVVAKNRKEIGSESPQRGDKEVINQCVVYKERPPRKIVEIRIFFDDNTFETLRPEK